MLAQAGRYWVFISIHALREEGDSLARVRAGVCQRRDDISIHTLREEGDRAGAGRTSALSDFYPRPP